MSEFPDHFSKVASGYAAARPVYPLALSQWLAAQSPARAHVWDVGCGNGQLSTQLATVFEAVTATDASAAQIAQAVAAPGVLYVVAPAEAVPLAPESCDAVVVAQAAHWFDLPRFYAEVRRVARPGAVLALITYARADLVQPAATDLLNDYADRIAGPYWPPQRSFVETNYQDIEFPWPRMNVPELVIEHHWTVAQLLAYVRTWSATSAMLAAEGEARLLDFEAALHHAWGALEIPQLIRWPLTIVAARL